MLFAADAYLLGNSANDSVAVSSNLLNFLFGTSGYGARGLIRILRSRSNIEFLAFALLEALPYLCHTSRMCPLLPVDTVNCVTTLQAAGTARNLRGKCWC
jgi:hypothetical protein